MEYPKINTLFKRDLDNLIIPTAYTFEEFEYLENNKFECTEKIDGTNVRVELSMVDDELKIEFKGRTDKAVLPAALLARLKKIFTAKKLNNIFKVEDFSEITIYGEGYGAKIQGCGGKYIKNGVDFILFDVKCDRWWLDRKACEDIANQLGIQIVPLVGYMTIPEAIEYVKKGFKSSIAEDSSLDAEGLVLKTPNGLLFRSGNRIITKIKTCDFVKLKAKYPDYE